MLENSIRADVIGSRYAYVWYVCMYVCMFVLWEGGHMWTFICMSGWQAEICAFDKMKWLQILKVGPKFASLHVYSLVSSHIFAGFFTYIDWFLHIHSLVSSHIFTGFFTYIHWSLHIYSLVSSHIFTGFFTYIHWFLFTEKQIPPTCISRLQNRLSAYHSSRYMYAFYAFYARWFIFVIFFFVNSV